MDLYKRVLTLIVVILIGVAIVLLARHSVTHDNQAINQSINQVDCYPNCNGR